MRIDKILLTHIKGVDEIFDSKWKFTFADNGYRKKDPIKIQANGVYKRKSPVKWLPKKINFSLVFRTTKQGGRLRLTRIMISGEHNSQTRIQIRNELIEKFKFLKSTNLNGN